MGVDGQRIGGLGAGTEEDGEGGNGQKIEELCSH
jgi:hypothetical protein